MVLLYNPHNRVVAVKWRSHTEKKTTSNMLTAEILSLLASLVQMLNCQQRYNADVVYDFNGMLKYELRNARRRSMERRACCCCSRDAGDDANNAASDADNAISIASSSSESASAGVSNNGNTREGNATASEVLAQYFEVLA